MTGGFVSRSTLTAGTAKLRHGMIQSTALLGTALLVLYLATWTASILSASSASGGTARTYTTNFPLAENPISEGGKWVNGKKDAFDWTDVRTIPGFAFGTEIGGNRPELEKYDDSTSLLMGTWGPNQTAQATVRRVNKDNDNV